MSRSLVLVRDVAFARAHSIFGSLSFDLARRDRVGLIGENGAGKTTLLRMLAGELTPDAGSIRRAPGLVVRLGRHGLESAEEAVHQLIVDDPAAWRSRLSLGDEADIARWPTLSPGERRRWQLAALLHGAPDLLLLDEPTDHLDARARAIIIDALRDFDGALLVASHDRDLLEAVCPRTLRLHQGRARLYDASAREALALVRQEERDAEAARERARERVRRTARSLAGARDEARSAEHARSGRVRMRNKYDSDGRGMGAQVRADWASSRLARRHGHARRAHGEARAELDALAPTEKRVGRALHVGFQPLARPRLAVLAPSEVRIAGAPLAGPSTVVVPRDGRVRIAGENGAGKSTLLRALARAAGGSDLLFMPQQLTAAEERHALDALRRLPHGERGRAQQLLAALGVDPARALHSEHPSAGEARKALLAHALARGAPAVLLDEPTNHLDLPSIERLEAALRDYPGALVVVTHDDAFAGALHILDTWRIHDGALTCEASSSAPEARARLR
jgi:ATPase subunit of ABC transporter with duplicated ATPase domains